jgi:integral membrane protein (TIGR00529 family)
MEPLLNMPALIKVGLIFALVLLVHRFKVHLGLSLLIGALSLGLIMGMSPADALLMVLAGLVSGRTLSLSLLVIVILVLSRLMSDSGQLERIVDRFKALNVGPRTVAAVMPALIGLLPMPGGALFSAPMVASACGRDHGPGELKTVINYWFRHIWEYWWPLYPGVILAISILGVESWKFVLFQMPLTGLSILGGWLFLLRRMPKGGPAASPLDQDHSWRAFLYEALPIVMVVAAIFLVWLVELAIHIKLPGLTSVFAGLVLCMGATIWQNGIGAKTVVRAAWNKSIGPMVVLIFGIMAFQHALSASEAVAGIQADLVQYGIPSLLIIVVMPFISGVVTGIAVGFVGASFPLVAPLIADLSGIDFFAHAALAYTFGFMGMMISPVHLCFLVSRDYFKADLGLSYGRLAGPVVFNMVVVGALFGLWLLVG